MELIDYFVVLAGSTIANAVFNHFEKHLSWWRRLAKLAAVLTVLALVGAALGRHAFYAALAFLTIGQIILHAWVVSAPRPHGRAL